MPTITVAGFRIAVNTRGERGHVPHVHVIKGRAVCKVPLDDALAITGAKRKSRRDVRTARELVAEHFDYLLALWEAFHG